MSTREFVVRSSADFGRTIAEARFLRGLTQAELAERTGIERTYLARLENGHATIQLDRILDTFRSLGLTVSASLEIPDA